MAISRADFDLLLLPWSREIQLWVHQLWRMDFVNFLILDYLYIRGRIVRSAGSGGFRCVWDAFEVRTVAVVGLSVRQGAAAGAN